MTGKANGFPLGKINTVWILGFIILSTCPNKGDVKKYKQIKSIQFFMPIAYDYETKLNVLIIKIKN